MTQETIKDIILKTLSEMGISIDVPDSSPDKVETSPPQDIDIRDYIADSIMFISFVIELEKKLEIEFPDELLLIDTLSSLSGFTYLLAEIINKRKEDCNEKGTEEADAQCRS